MTHAELNSNSAALRWPATAVPGAARDESPFTWSAVSWSTSNVRWQKMRGKQAEVG
jgi:hypothetical protein